MLHAPPHPLPLPAARRSPRARGTRETGDEARAPAAGVGGLASRAAYMVTDHTGTRANLAPSPRRVRPTHRSQYEMSWYSTLPNSRQKEKRTYVSTPPYGVRGTCDNSVHTPIHGITVTPRACPHIKINGR